MSFAISQDQVDPAVGMPSQLLAIQQSIAELTGMLASVLDEIRSRPTPTIDSPAKVTRTSYSVEEIATMLGKSNYTVREWCRNGQVNATRRAARRTGGTLWSISADELARYRNEGLLPIDPRRNRA